MKIHWMKFARLAAAVSWLCAGSLPVQAQAWPAKPIKLIVPNAAGTATDTMARLLAADVGRALGQGMYVENITGPQGITGHVAAARAEPDGYTFLFTNTSGLAGNPVSFLKLPYDPAKDFTPVAMVCDLGPQLVSVNRDTSYKNIADVIADAKANPGKYAYAVDASVGSAIIAGRLLTRRAGIEIAEASYRGPQQMGLDVASGRVPILISSIVVANPYLQSGQLRPIAITSGSRFPGLPDVPSVGETVPGYAVDGWFAVVAPRGVPEPIIQRVNQAIGEFLKGGDIQKRLIAIGLATSGAGTPASTGEFIAVQQERWRVMAKELDIERQ